jgi:micrococcal nuclease
MPGPGRGLGAIVLLLVLVAVLLFGDGGDDSAGPGFGGGSGSGTAPGQSLTVSVSRVVDGDTIEVGIDGGTDDVRLIGVDTPETVKPGEPVECFGPEASDFTHRLLEGRTVRLVFDRERRDVYDRLLAYVYLGERFVNAELIEGGYARTLEIEPNTAHAEQLARLEGDAGAAGRGLWGAC